MRYRLVSASSHWRVSGIAGYRRSANVRASGACTSANTTSQLIKTDGVPVPLCGHSSREKYVVATDKFGARNSTHSRHTPWKTSTVFRILTLVRGARGAAG